MSKVASNRNSGETSQPKVNADILGLSDLSFSYQPGNDSTLNEYFDIETKPWITEVETFNIFNVECNCFITYILETDPIFHGMVHLINKGIESCKRKAVRVISMESIQKMAMDHCFKSGEMTPFSALCEAVKIAGGPNFRNNIPVELLAYMIKYMIIFEQQNYLKAQLREKILKRRAYKRYINYTLKYDADVEEEEEEQEEEKMDVDEGNNKEVVEEFDPCHLERNLKKEKKRKIKEKLQSEESEEMGTEEMEEKLGIAFRKGKWKGLKKLKGKLIENVSSLFFLINNTEEDFEEEEIEEEEDAENQDYIKEKMETLLHKRGEPVRDLYSIDDSPINGPDLYIMISSFKESQLPEAMNLLKIPPRAYLFIGCNVSEPLIKEEGSCGISLFEELNEEYGEYMDLYSKYFSLISFAIIDQYSKNKKLNPTTVYENMKTELNTFYDNFLNKVCSINTKHQFDNIIVRKYIPNLDGINFQKKDWIRKLTYLLYGNVSRIAYHFYKITVLYEKYLGLPPYQNLDVPFQIPSHQISMYLTIMDGIPNEVASVPVILDTIIAQVCYNSNSYAGYDINYFTNIYINNESLFRIDDEERILEEKIKQLRQRYFPITKFDDKLTLTLTLLFGDKIYFDTNNFTEWGHFVRNRTEHILSIYFENIFTNFKPELSQYNENMNAFHFENLQMACENLNIKGSKIVLEILLSLMSVDVKNIPLSVEKYLPDLTEIISRKSNDSTNVNRSEINFFALMDILNITEETKFKIVQEIIFDEELKLLNRIDFFKCHEFIEEVLKKLRNDKERIIELFENFKQFEELPRHVFLQTLWDELEENNTININYVPLINKLIFTCFNKPKIITEKGYLPKHTCLRDFYDYGLTELKDWCNNQDEQLQETFFSEMYTVKDKIIDPISLVDIINNPRLNDRHCQTLLGIKKIDYKQLIKNNRYKKMELVDNAFVFKMERLLKESLCTNIRQYVFIGDTIVTFKIYGQMYKYPNLTVNVKQGSGTLTFHKSLDNIKSMNNLLFSHKTGIKINFYEIFLPNRKEEKIVKNFGKIKNVIQGIEDEIIGESEEEFEEEEIERIELPKINDPNGEKSTLFQYHLTLPSGLALENKTLSDGYSYVRQSYIVKGANLESIKNESCRIHLKDGSLIKLFNGDTFEMYYACGRIVSGKINQLFESYEDVIFGSESYDIEDAIIVLEPDANLFRIIAGYKNMIKKLKIEEYNEIFNDKRTVIIPDGPKLEFNCNELQIVTFPDGTRITSIAYIDETEIFCEWTQQELQNWFQGFRAEEYGEYDESIIKEYIEGKIIVDRSKTMRSIYFDSDSLDYIDSDFTSDQDVEKTMHKTRFVQGHFKYYHKIDLNKDGFLCIEQTHVIEHPCYISTTTYPSEPEKIAFLLPKDVVLVCYGNGCFDLLSEPDSLLHIRSEEIIFDKLKNKELIQRSILNYNIFEESNKNNEANIFFYTKDIENSWLIADTNFTAKFHILSECDNLSENEINVENLCKFYTKNHEEINLIPKQLFTTSKRLIMDENLSGIGLYLTSDTIRPNNAVNMNCNKIKTFEEYPFNCQIQLFPIIEGFVNWRNDFLKIEETSVYQTSSIYGDNWHFPLMLKNKIKCNIPSLILIRYLNEFISKNIFKDFLLILSEYQHLLADNYKNIDIDKLLSNGIYKPQFVFNTRNIPNTTIGLQAVNLRGQLFKNIQTIVDFNNLKLLEDPKLIIEKKFIFKKKYSEDYFKKKTHDLYLENFVPFFESSKGVAFYILDSILTIVIKSSFAIHLKDKMDELFEKPIKSLTKEDLLDIESFLKIYYNQIWGDKKRINIRKLLRSAVELSDFFPNMGNALDFNVSYHGKYSIDEYCKKKETAVVDGNEEDKDKKKEEKPNIKQENKKQRNEMKYAKKQLTENSADLSAEGSKELAEDSAEFQEWLMAEDGEEKISEE